MDLDYIFNHPHFPKYYKSNREDWKLVETENGPVLKLEVKSNCWRNVYSLKNGRYELDKSEDISDSSTHFVCIRLDSAKNLIMFGEKKIENKA